MKKLSLLAIFLLVSCAEENERYEEVEYKGVGVKSLFKLNQ